MRVKLVLAITSPTAFLEVNGVPSMVQALQSLRSIGSFLPITVAVSSSLSMQVRKLLRGENADTEVLDCEPTMVRSFAEALAPARVDAEAILIHDASRPLTGKKQFEGVLSSFSDEIDAVRPAIAFTETLKVLDKESVIKKTLDRSSVLRISTPELIRVSAIDFAGSDCGWFLPLKKEAHTLHIEGSLDGLRINTAEDRNLMELHTN